jgi:exodeoxyribonuclease VII small subunit
MAKRKSRKDKEPSFEDLMDGLEEIAAELESGELGLEKAIARYEEGVKTYRRCHKILTDAEKKVEVLTRDQDGTLQTVPFGDDVEEGEASEANETAPVEDEEDADDSLF